VGDHNGLVPATASINTISQWSYVCQYEFVDRYDCQVHSLLMKRVSIGITPILFGCRTCGGLGLPRSNRPYCSELASSLPLDDALNLGMICTDLSRPLDRFFSTDMDSSGQSAEVMKGSIK
jgi:hypothetical protein